MGGDQKCGVTQNLTADLTINTDFSQVEVDEQQVNLTRFNLFFPEKRDFFLEGLGTFAFADRASAGLAAGFGDTPYLFFSRRIGLDSSRVNPLRAGGRASGKAGHFTFGAINVQTGDDEQARVESANFTVLRAKRDILRRSSVGGMFTHRTATPGRSGSNDGFGLDASMSFHQNVRVDAYVAGTRTEGREGDNLSYRGFFDYNADKFGRIGYVAGQQRRVSGEIVFETGAFYNGDRQSIAVTAARMQVTPQVSVEPSFSINWVDLVQGSFTAKVARARVTYTITPRMFVSGILQYNSANASVGSNLRFRWEYQPGSELFVVYTDDYDSDPRPNTEPLRNRAFVVKFNRLFRL